MMLKLKGARMNNTDDTHLPTPSPAQCVTCSHATNPAAEIGHFEQ